MLKVGAIGMGRRLTCGVTASLLRLGEDVQVTAIADPNPEYSKGFMKAYHIPIEPARFYPSAEEMLRTEKNLDGIMIGTRCYLHPEMMRLAAQANIPVFLEKPVFIDEKGKEILKNLQSVHEAPVEVSFPLRMTQPAQLAGTLSVPAYWEELLRLRRSIRRRTANITLRNGIEKMRSQAVCSCRRRRTIWTSSSS